MNGQSYLVAKAVLPKSALQVFVATREASGQLWEPSELRSAVCFAFLFLAGAKTMIKRTKKHSNPDDVPSPSVSQAVMGGKYRKRELPPPRVAGNAW